MSFFLNSLFSRNRGSRVPVEDQDINLHLSEENTNDSNNLSLPSSQQVRSAEIEENNVIVSNAVSTEGIAVPREENPDLHETTQPQPQSQLSGFQDQTDQDDEIMNNSRRRPSTYILILMIFLLKLWIDALTTGNFSLLIICILGTAWISGMLRNDAEVDQRMNMNSSIMMDDERILENMGISNYQAQLNAAIWESRMLAMMGGITERDDDGTREGVSEESQMSWQTFQFSDATIDDDIKKGSDTSRLIRSSSSQTQQQNQNQVSECPTSIVDLEAGKQSLVENMSDKNACLKLSCEEDNTCSICLSEYENDDEIARLPCSHLFHKDCVMSWTRNHVRCPLCNFDLENGNGNVGTSTTTNPV